jgi:hypothetical protein
MFNVPLIDIIIHSSLDPQPGLGLEPGGFVMPGGPGGPGGPGPPGGPGVPFRPGTAPPPGVVYAPPPPFPPQQYPGVVPPVVPRPGVYETPTPSESPVIPSPPSREGGVFVAPPIGPFRDGIAPAPQVYQPPIPEDEEGYIPPPPSRTPSMEYSSPRPSVAPVLVPGPQIAPQPTAPPFMVIPPSQGSQYPVSRRSETPSTERRGSPSPPLPFAPSAGQPTIINIPPQPAPGIAAAPGVPMAPTQPAEAPSGPPVVQILPSPRPPRSERSEYGPELPQQSGLPIIIQPPHPPGMPTGFPFPPGAVPPPVMVPGAPRSPSPSRSPTPSRSRSYSPRPLRESFPSQPPMMMPPGPPGFGVVPMPAPGPPVTVPPVTVVAPSQPYEPRYRSPTPESRRSYSPPRAPSRGPSRYEERPVQPIQPIAPIPSGVHIVPTEPYPYPTRYRRGRYPESMTPPTERSLSPEFDERERPRDRRDRDRDQLRSPPPERPRSTVYPIPPSRGPSEYGRPGLPPPVTHIHGPVPASPSFVSRSLTEEPEPLQHPYGPPTQYPPSQQVPVPMGIPPSTRPRASRAPTIVEVTGPEPIQIHPPDQGRPRTEPVRKYCMFVRSN